MLSSYLLVLYLTSSADSVIDLPSVDVDTGVGSAPELTTGVATVVEPEADVGTAETLADVLSELPGLHLRRAGSLGAFTSLSIRGLGGEHVGVLLDDVPLTGGAFGAADLSLVPIGTLERVEVYRGAGPVRFDSPLGGVVRLVTRLPKTAPQASAHVGYGSWQTRTAHLGVTGPLLGARAALALAYQGSAGDFRYYDDRYTLSNTTDDRLVTRRNNAFNQGYARAALELDGPGGGRWLLRLGGRLQAQGVPGAGLVPTEESRAAEREGDARVGLEGATLLGDRLRLGGGVDLVTLERRFEDPRRETGLMVGDVTTRLRRIGGDGRLELLSTLEHETELAPRVAFERYQQRGTVNRAGAAATERRRLTLGAGLEHRADVTPWLRLVPALRADAVNDPRGTTSPEVSPRLGAILFAEPCELRLNGGRFHRFPSPLELYGDDVTTVANLALGPERGLSADLGMGCELTDAVIDEVRLDLAVFGTRAEELIVLGAASQTRLRAQNLRRAELRGVEASLRLEEDIAGVHAGLDAAYTLTAARTRTVELGLDGKPPPGVPRHQVTAGVEVGPEAVRLRYELSYVSATPLVLAGTLVMPGRALHDVFLTAQLGAGLALKLTVTNLFDLAATEVPLRDASGGTGVSRVSDFIGYPLPGRGIFASLVWRSS